MNNIDVNQYEFAETSRKNKIKSAIEAMLFVAGEPLNIKDIYTNLELDRKTVKEILNELAEDFKSESRGIKLINIDDLLLSLKTQNLYKSYLKRITDSHNHKLP